VTGRPALRAVSPSGGQGPSAPASSLSVPRYGSGVCGDDDAIAIGLMLPQGTTGEALRVAVTAADRICVSPRAPIPIPPGHRLDLWAKSLEAKARQLLGEVPASGGAPRFGGLASDVATVMITGDPLTPGAATGQNRRCSRCPGGDSLLGPGGAFRFDADHRLTCHR
jgi:hypothetical protein